MIDRLETWHWKNAFLTPGLDASLMCDYCENSERGRVMVCDGGMKGGRKSADG